MHCLSLDVRGELSIVQCSSDAAQESTAAWNADDDAHEDKSEIDEQLNCVRYTNQPIHFTRICNERGVTPSDFFFL